MLKFERTDKQVSLEMDGNLLEIMADITLLLKVVYKHLEKNDKEEFRFIFSHAIARPDFPAWDGSPLPGEQKVQMAPGVEDLIKHLAEQKGTEADESGT